MYYFFALAAGVLISLMAVFNGRLTAEAGLCLTTAIIHVVAIIFALIILWIKKESFIPKQKLPLWMYCGGLISVACTLCSNYAFGKISLIAITALGLLAQMLTSLVIDCLGLLGAEKRRVLPVTWACIAFSFCGIVYMLYGSELSVFSAIAASFAAGVGLVVSRAASAALAEHECEVETAVYAHGTHFVFPEGMLKIMLPMGAGLFVRLAFQAAKQFPEACRQTRQDIDRRVSAAIHTWTSTE